VNREPRAGFRVELGSWYGRRSTSEGLDSFVRHNGVETLTLLEESVRSSRRAKNRFHTVVHSTRVCIFRRMVSLTHFTRGAISIWMGWVNQRRTSSVHRAAERHSRQAPCPRCATRRVSQRLPAHGGSAHPRRAADERFGSRARAPAHQATDGSGRSTRSPVGRRRGRCGGSHAAARRQ